MKHYTIIITALLLALFSCKTETKGVLYEGQKIAMPEYYRHITGYDSIQFIFMDHKKANFCYPNEWEFAKFEKDTIYIHDTVYTSKSYRNVGTVNIGPGY